MIKHLDTRQNFKQLMSNWGLLIILCFTIFALPLFTAFLKFRLFEIFVTLIVLISAYATSEEGKPKVILQVLVAFVAIWITRIADLEVINYLASIWLVVFFMLRVLKFIRQLSRKEDVNALVIIEAINGYLLIGVGFGILINMITNQFPGAFNFATDASAGHIYDSFYYTFVSMTTLGYGDLLPHTPMAKSLALMITLCGQFYLVIIMALLVGRLLTGADRKH
ncbi:two pore domain potassium channel family protein [Carboxylicivirga sp. A043]|uniref:potassium channel family protein n=1 Tax=Carboxylicivirga litoralis TaxID=2816963 RepID=UPI0021CB8E92|nr:potassium channel family protein [Carboxylicivirga sp. A043]MCU4157554.1 two pore domain potassium channel family protein [Carboxylicivirga sp. A043]